MMAKGAKKMVVPKLRFPEFRGAAEWQQIPLGKSGEFIRGLTYGASDVNSDGLLVLRSTNIQEGNLVLDRDLVFVGKECSTELTLQPGDIVICMSNGSKALVGKSAEYKGGYSGALTVGAFCSIFRAKLPFAKLAFSTRCYADFVALEIGGGNINNLKNSSLEAFEFALPQEPAEQQQIADCLTSLDELIAAQGRKVEALKTYKRGLMQQLFPRKGETLPHLRFPEFRDAPEWEDVPLGDLFDTSSGGTPDRAKREYWAGSIPWVTTSLVDFNVITKADEFINDAGLENSSAKVFPKGTVLIAMYGQGITRGKVAMLGIPAATNQACAAILPNDEVDNGFTFVSLCGRYEEMRKLSNSGGQENLSQALIRALPFRYPKDVEEQTKIVECFSEIDALIVGEVRKLDALKIQKEGLMQQLFPSVEETK